MKEFTLSHLGFFLLGIAITAVLIRASLLGILLACLIGISIYLITNRNKDKEVNINKEEEE